MYNKSKRVVVTGLGTVTPYGAGVKTFWDNLKSGKSCIKKGSVLYNWEIQPTQICGEFSDFNPEDYMDHKEAKRIDRSVQFAVVAADEAAKDAGITEENVESERLGVFIGCGSGGLASVEKNHMAMVEKGPIKCSPFTVPMMITNMSAGVVAIKHKAKGPNFAIVSACATGGHAIGEAYRAILYGDADVMFAGGTEAAITNIGIGAFGAARTLSKRNDEPEKASRPYDKDRDGFVMSEGAGILILEELEHAKKRGAKIYCELVGYGTSCDAYDMVAPSADGEGAARAMSNALKDAELKSEDVDYINTHGTSTMVGDIAEINGIVKVFGDYATNGLKISSTKSMHGHLLGAAGGVEAVASIMAMQQGIVPPTINLENPDEHIPEGMNLVPNKAQESGLDVVMSNSFGFGGQNVSLVFKRFVG